MLTIIHEPKQGGGVRDSITAITPVHKSTTVPKQVAPRIVYDIDQHTDAVFDKVPSYLQEWILKSPEGQEARNGKPAQQPTDPADSGSEDREGIPF